MKAFWLTCLFSATLILNGRAQGTVAPVANASSPSSDPVQQLLDASEQGNLDEIQKLVDQGVDVNAAGANGVTALMRAASGNQIGAVTELLKDGAKLDAQSDRGWNPLMFAARDAREPMLEKLLDAQVDIESKSKTGQTPLIIAAQNGRVAAVNLLLSRGANVNATDDQGNSALVLAGNAGSMDIVQLLIDKGAQPTQFHIIPQPPAVPPLSPARTWALAVSVIYTQHNYGNPHVLGGGMDPARATEMMRHDWKIQKSADLLAILDILQAKRESAKMIAYGRKASLLTNEQFNQLMATERNREPAMRALRAGYWKWQDRLGVAWDLCRAANLINLGYDAGYLSEQDAWSRLIPIAVDIKNTFTSWKEMADNFVDGRVIVQGHEPRFDALEQLLTDPQEPNSPWNQIPWATDLSAP